MRLIILSTSNSSGLCEIDMACNTSNSRMKNIIYSRFDTTKNINNTQIGLMGPKFQLT